MANTELSKKLPRFVGGISWPTPIPGKGVLHLNGQGTLRSYRPNSREQMIDFINRSFYGDDREGYQRAERIMNGLDWTPVGTLNASYDTTRAISEGRFNDALISSGLAFLPALRKAPTGLFNPIPKPPRNVSDDFPNGAPLDEDGYVTRDMEGRPFDALFRVGRVRLDAPDHALRPINIQSVGEYALERPIVKNSRDYFDSGTLGETWTFGGKPEFVHILDSLSRADADIVTAHEVAHVIDQLAGEIPTQGLDKELNFVYNAMQTGKERKFLQSLPEDVGYSGLQVQREKMAEAIRAYMVDPNYLKTVAPQTAKRIRQHVNSHPELSKIIQFNSVGAGGAVGLGLMGREEDSQSTNGPQNGQRQPDILKGANSNFRASTIPPESMTGVAKTGSYGLTSIAEAVAHRGGASQAPSAGKYTSIARALLDLQAKQRLPSFGGPR
jgi:hypothetical protein